MDVSELLAFQPHKPVTNLPVSEKKEEGPKRKRRIDEGSLKSTEKKLAVANNIKSSEFENTIHDEDKERLNKLLEDDPPEMESLDEPGIKRLIFMFEKKMQRNQEMRVKYPDMPEKFMESEIELNESIQAMHVIATVADYYRLLVAMNTIPQLLQLLNHDNTDVSIAVVDLIQEITDVDIATDNQQAAELLFEDLLRHEVLSLLVENLKRLDESSKEEAQGIHQSLSILENLIELRPQVSMEAAKAGFIHWLLNKLKTKAPLDDNRLYYSEILSILIQNNKENRQLLGDLDGIDILLSQLSVYKKQDPHSPDEVEMMSNLFNCLCSSLMLPSNKIKFLKGEGLQLMNLMLRERKKLCKYLVFKVLDHSMMGEKGAENCQKYVDILGLKSLFPFFMRTPKPNKKCGVTKMEMEEHIVSTVASLLRNCEGLQRQRLLNKFTENDHEKVDRLMDLHFEYVNLSHQADLKIEKKKKLLERKGGEIPEEMEEDFMMSRLEAGLFTLQLVDFIIVEVSNSSPPSVKSRVNEILSLRGGDIKSIKAILRDYAGSIGEENENSEQRAFRNRILQMIDKF